SPGIRSSGSHCSPRAGPSTWRSTVHSGTDSNWRASPTRIWGGSGGAPGQRWSEPEGRSDCLSLLQQRALERVALAEADAVDVAGDDAVRGPQRRLGVADPEPLAVRPDRAGRLTQVRARHRGEQVMLDLVVQPAHGDIEQAASADV